MTDTETLKTSAGRGRKSGKPTLRTIAELGLDPRRVVIDSDADFFKKAKRAVDELRRLVKAE